jgi:hypothetical protein
VADPDLLVQEPVDRPDDRVLADVEHRWVGDAALRKRSR